jgi:DNA polymerase IV (DinB-like DNA polymerase)|tara:strand:- start:956 stop:2050 length:1095 start_codon:yes stop_codon:yes gene_type:complete
MENRIVLHVDFDYFYAQCEESRNPDLKGKPVVVCIFSDRGGDSGAVATANYTARKFGVKSGIPIAFAKSRLKDSIESVFLSADFDYYSDISSSAMSIIESFADVFEYVGRDEAYLDVTSRTDSDFERASHIAQQLKNEIQKKIKMTCSVGVSPNKLISKIASDYKKPDGLTIIKPTEIMKFLGSLELRKIPGIGKKTESVFTDLNCRIIDDILKFDVFELNKKFGRKTGTYIYNCARGIDNNLVKLRAPTIQFSKIITLKENSKDLEFLSDNLKILCKQVNTISVEKQKMFRSVGIQFVNEDLTTKTKSRMLKNPTNSVAELEKVSLQLLIGALENQELLIRRLGLRVSELTDVEGQSDITSYF